MSALQKLRLLSPASQVKAGEYGCRLPFQNVDHGIVLTKAMLPNGKAIRLLKSVLTSCCENDCLYCPMRKGRDFRRVSFQPEEDARLALNLTNAGLVQGIFLSSGLAGGGVRTQDPFDCRRRDPALAPALIKRTSQTLSHAL